MTLFRLIRILYTQLKSSYNFYVFRREWRKLNSHNFTNPKSIFPIDSVVVGKNSYGDLNIECFGNPRESLIIGHYVSIGRNATFILGGNHQTTTVTNYPLYSSFIEASPLKDAQTKGAITIEDEVWIGFGVIILSGVKIGKGAIVAAGAVVTKDVEAYSIVGGNPAIRIKYRFNEDLREALQDLNLIDFETQLIVDNITEFYNPLDLNQIERLKKLRSQ